MPQLFGGIEMLDEVETLTGNVRVLGAIAYLRALYQALDEAGYGDRIMIDLGLVHEMDYYTGIMFRGLHSAARGAAILAGAATSACARSSAGTSRRAASASTWRALRRAFRARAVPRSQRARYGPHRADQGPSGKENARAAQGRRLRYSELEAGTRKLIFTLPDSGVEIVLSKAADVITYVEHGVCDMGVVGKDTIMEKGGSFYEMVDLGFGRCRFASATKKGKDVYGGYKTPVIATKYPAVTRRSSTGRTWTSRPSRSRLGRARAAARACGRYAGYCRNRHYPQENGLEVIEDVAPISARVIVNLASAKMKKTAIQKVIAELEKGLEK